MKKIVWMSFFLSVVMLLMPLSAINAQPKALEAANMNNINNETKEKKETSDDVFRIYNHETEKITEMKAEDYIFGVVAAEMPALYDKEALKAQAVAAYTYACYNRTANKEKEYDVSTDYNTSQSFITEEQAEKKWGSKAEDYKKKIKTAIKEAKGYTVKYNGEIILAVYHAISSGKTEDSANVWGKEYPYLKSVDTSFDTDAENYCATVELTQKELKEMLGEKIDEKASPKDYFGDLSLSKTGLVKEIEVCGNKYTGASIRELLELRSSNFTVNYKDEKFIFKTYGYGHGVGMSQYGANCLAKNGKNFKEILCYFYTDCTVEK